MQIQTKSTECDDKQHLSGDEQSLFFYFHSSKYRIFAFVKKINKT